MSNRLIFCEFPKGAKSICINNKRYSRAEFEKAKELEKRRGKKGRFIKLDG